MDHDAIAGLFGLPILSRVDKRVPKSMLGDTRGATAADRTIIASAIESLTWVAALKPANCGVKAYSDELRDYSEVQVLRLEVRGARGVQRLRRVVHRAVPYPVLLVTIALGVEVSVAHVRRSQAAPAHVVVEDEIEAAHLPLGVDQSWAGTAVAALTFTAQPANNFFTLYDGWRASLIAIRAAERTGQYRRPRGSEAVESRRAALAECERIEKDIAAVRAAARRTPQRSRQVTFTADLRRLERSLLAAVERI